MSEYKFKISIIMAVYNVEPFLRKSIESVVKQNIGFENIQLILVDDGSSDGSGAICDEYAEKYPENVVVIHKENGGVSSARNLGLEHVQGKYVNVLDSDDKLSYKTAQLVYDFFEDHYDEVDLVAIPLIFFDAVKGKHPLNIKFKRGTRVIDLQDEWDLPQLSLSSTFVKADAIKNLRFDSRLAFAEDAQLVAKILLEKQKMGVVSRAKYYYRKRSVGEASAIQTSGKTWNWFLPCLEHFNEHTIKYCIDKVGYVPKFIQFIVMYDLQFKFRQGHIPEGVLTEEEEAEYKTRMYALLSVIDDDVILGQRSLNVEQKIHLIRSKHPDQEDKLLYSHFNKSTMLALDNVVLWDMGQFQLKIHFMNVADNHITICGEYAVPTKKFGTPGLFARIGDEEYEVSLTDYDHSLFCMNDAIWEHKGFTVTLPLKDKNSIDFVLKYDELALKQWNIYYGKYCPITKKLKSSYYYKDGYKITAVSGGISVNKVGWKEAFKAEIAVLKELRKKKDKSVRRVALNRILIHLIRPFAPKNIWLIADKADRADDNGEAFFMYCTQLKGKAKCRPVFAIDKESPDYKRLKKYGKVIPYMSRKHKLCHVFAAHTISGYSHQEISSPFLTNTEYYSDLLQNNKIVFLQHGITKDDVSDSLNRNRTNFELFVTSAQAEYDSILKYNYGYNEDNVILTGMPRYDRLYNNDQKKITIMPTWRRNLFSTYNPTTSIWSLLPGFEKSQFYCFYCSLLSSERLISAAKEMGYSIQLLMHPTLFPYLDKFEIDSSVKLLKSNVVYRDVFAESSLIVTDYSSVAFDMAYLRKPVLYAHFDGNHYAEGYFDYERDGFGEVEHDLDGTIDRIIEYMKNDCRLKNEYRNRIDKFFLYDDKNNCQRVYEKIIELDKKS